MAGSVFRDIVKYEEIDGQEEREEVVEKTAEECRKEFVEWIRGEIMDSQANLEGRFKKIQKYRRMRESIPEQEVKNTPYPGSSNVVVPATLWLIQTLYGEIKNTFALRDPFWVVKAMYKDPDLVEKARVLTNYFGLIADSPQDLDLRNQNKTIIYDTCSLGTCYVKYPYIRKSWQIMGTSEGGVDQPTTVTAHDGLAIIPYPEEDVLYPTGATSLQDSPWVAFVDHYFEHDLLQRAAEGTFDNVEEVLIRGNGLDGENGESRENWARQARDYGIEVDTRGMYDVAEVYAFYDVNGDGKPEDVIVTVHLASGHVLNEQFNGIGRRPMGAARYMMVPYQMGGRGGCQMTEKVQEEMDTTHNMRIDYNRYAITPMIKARRGSGIKPNEKMSLGKLIMVDEMDDFEPVQLAPLNYASVTEENLGLTYAQRATGVSEIMAGFSDSVLKSRDTLGGQMLRLQQGKGMFGAVISGMQDFYSEMGQIMFYQMVHNRKAIIEKETKLKRMSKADIGILEKALDIPLDEVPMRLQFFVRTRNVEETKDVQQKNLLMLTQLITQHTQQTAQALMMVNNPQMPVPEPVRDAIMKGVEANSRILEQILELINIDNTEDYLISGDTYEAMERQRKAQMMMQQLQQQMLAALAGPQAAQGGINGQSPAGRIPAGIPAAIGSGGAGQPGQTAGAGAQAQAQGAARTVR